DDGAGNAEMLPYWLLSRSYSTLFPYTTLFRSLRADRGVDRHRVAARRAGERHGQVGLVDVAGADRFLERGESLEIAAGRDLRFRSEEHTSELQSRENLVCRLLREKANRIGEVL